MMHFSKVNPVVASDDGTGDSGAVVVNDQHYRQGNVSFHAVSFQCSLSRMKPFSELL